MDSISQQNQIIIFLIVAFVILAIYYMYQKKNKKCINLDDFKFNEQEFDLSISASDFLKK